MTWLRDNNTHCDPKKRNMPNIGEIIEWQELDDGRWITLRADIIEHNGELYANGCGSFKDIDSRFVWRVVGANQP